ncbi:MAG: biopolymer transporter ExbD, partial [Victivallales bacterium]|nr:biopolymer transporter ExbD [Victivallales bacterium]
MRIKKSEALAVPMSSMIDIVFLLLIYFIVTMED